MFVVLCLVAFLLAGVMPAQGGLSRLETLLARGNGESSWTNFYPAAGAGDFNGDGFADVVIGHPYFSTSAEAAGCGKFYVFFGSADASGERPAPDVSIRWAPKYHSFFGFSVAGIGDLNGDGFDDVAVGMVPRDGPVDYTYTTETGNVFIYWGSSLIPAPDAPYAVSIQGEKFHDYFGAAIAGIPNFDGDEYPDIVVGAPGNDRAGQGAGAAYIFLGRDLLGRATVSASEASVIITGESPGDVLGNSVACAGDVNGDGLDDAIIGAHWSDRAGPMAGAAYVIFGSPRPPSLISAHDADVVLVGEQPEDQFGTSVGGCGDVNNDGFDDIVVGAPFFDRGRAEINYDAGKAYVFLGGPGFGGVISAKGALLPVLGASSAGLDDQPWDHFGYSVAGCGDIDGDGYGDFVVAAMDFGLRSPFDTEGRIYVYLGGPGVPDGLADEFDTGLGPQYRLGQFVNSVGDFNGDGLDDFLGVAAGPVDVLGRIDSPAIIVYHYRPD